VSPASPESISTAVQHVNATGLTQNCSNKGRKSANGAMLDND